MPQVSSLLHVRRLKARRRTWSLARRKLSGVLMKASKRSAPAKYEPTANELAALQSLAGKTLRVKILHSETGLKVVPTHPDEAVGLALLAQALGTTNVEFMYGLINQLLRAASTGSEINESGINFMLSVIEGIDPKDRVEAMLAAQMAAVQMATMAFARRLADAKTIAQQDSAERAFNKLARTFATQMEALKRYRTGGEQKVTVQHVTVNEGGQAIVGAVEAGGGVPSEKRKQPNAKALRHAPVAPLWGKDQEREPVPLAGDAEREVPRSRRGVARST